MPIPPTFELKLARVISGAIVGEREGVAAALGHSNRSRLDHICRGDEDHHPVYATEFFEIYLLAGRPDGFFGLFEELYDLKVVDLAKLPGRDPCRKALLQALKDLVLVLERYDDARAFDSDGGAGITDAEWGRIEGPLGNVLGRLVAFRKTKGQ